jgi:hypothetical protein
MEAGASWGDMYPLHSAKGLWVRADQPEQTNRRSYGWLHLFLPTTAYVQQHLATLVVYGVPSCIPLLQARPLTVNPLPACRRILLGQC